MRTIELMLALGSVRRHIREGRRPVVNWRAMLHDLFTDRKFFSVMLKVALPIAAQSLVFNALNAVDVLLIGQLGETSVAAVALSNQWTFLMNLFLFGTGSGAAIFTAQFWGKQDVPSLRKAFGIGLLIAVTGSVLFALAGITAPERVLRLYTNDIAVQVLGAPYLRVVAFSYVFTAMTTLFGIVLRTTRNVKLPVAVSVGALTFKTILAYSLIFGRLGLPEMGIAGAAIATVIARALECIVLLGLTYRWHLPPAFTPRDLRGIDRPFVATFATTTIPVILNEVIWSVGMSVYTGIYARIGTDSLAAVNISSTIEAIALVPMFGLGNACAIILGNAIGAGDSATARNYSRKFFALAILVGISVGGLIFGASRFILGAYNISPEARTYAQGVMTVMSFALWLKAVNLLVIVGILRSGGDTRFALAIDTGPMYLIGIPLALLGAFVLDLPVPLVVMMVLAGDELTKFVLGFWRVRSGRWLRNVVQAL
jgi:putative MATE family efflux protein